MRKIACWCIMFISCLSLGCAELDVSPPVHFRTSPSVVPTATKSLNVIDGLVMTNAGIDFDDTHYCSGSYASQASDMTYNEQRRTGYKIETTCTTTGEVHTQVFSDITYNQFGQRTGYQLQFSCSRTGKSYTIIISQLAYDNSTNWEVLSYTAEIDGKTYYYRR